MASKLTVTQRLNALILFLKEKHGFSFPADITGDAETDDEAGAVVDPDKFEEVPDSSEDGK